jgi:hypothetical protein
MICAAKLSPQLKNKFVTDVMTRHVDLGLTRTHQAMAGRVQNDGRLPEPRSSSGASDIKGKPKASSSSTRRIVGCPKLKK